MERFIGSMVSLDCGETLGTYQGQVITIDAKEGSITIVKPYRNGVPFKSPQVILRSQDIVNLTIVKSPDEAKDLPHVVNKRIQLASNLDSHPTNGVKAPAAKSNTVTPPNQTSSVALDMNLPFPQHVAPSNGGVNAFTKSKTAVRKTRTFQNSTYGDAVINSFVDSLNKIKVSDGSHTAAQTFSNGQDFDSQMVPLLSANLNRMFVAAADNKISGRKRTSSASEIPLVQKNRRAVTPRKADRQQQKNRDCFNDSEVFVDDFDFEKNLALFDKHAVFEEIEKERENGTCAQNSRTNRSEQKYQCYENVLPGSKTTYRQIKLLNGCVKKDAPRKEYVTDSGLLVPSVSLESRENLFDLAEKYGFSRERMVETTGRSASEMILQLLGGNSRFELRNSHQRPVVVVLCGAGLQGAIAANCARHLVTRSVTVLLFPSSPFHPSKEVEVELQLYRQTSGKFMSNSAELPRTTVDLIVSALSPRDTTNSSSDPWYRTVSGWANENKARVLTIDPLTEGSAIESSWCLTWGLPLSYSENCGQVYLCDLGIPEKIFKEAGVIYESPFAHKFVIPLHDS